MKLKKKDTNIHSYTALNQIKSNNTPILIAR
jgi:hypothetical protein